jgi:hypothetical protein
MLGSGKTGATGALATASRARRQVIYQQYAAALYRQALLMLADSAPAQDVVCDAIVDECALVPAQEHSEDEIRYRLVQSVFRRCQRLTADPGRPDRRPPRGPSLGVDDSVDPGGILSEEERGALGLVIFGGLGYVQASTVLGIGPRDTAALLRSAMGRLAISSAADAGTSKSEGLRQAGSNPAQAGRFPRTD